MRYLIILLVLLISSCIKPPKERINQFEQVIDYYIQEDTLVIYIENPLYCPIRTKVFAKNPKTQSLLDQDFPITLRPLSNKHYKYALNKMEPTPDLNFSTVLGEFPSKIQSDSFVMPFPKGKTYKIVQGYHGTFSHNHDYARYALDFDLKTGDTVCAAADGRVVGVIEGYKDGGNHKKWANYANFITIYHAQMGLYSQYVHLDYQGSLVEVGDSVAAGMSIGISGMTGHTSIEHLHFNVLQPDSTSMVSTPVVFVGGVDGHDLTKGTIVIYEVD